MNLEKLISKAKENVEVQNAIFRIADVDKDVANFVVNIMDYFDVDSIEELKEKLDSADEKVFNGMITYFENLFEDKLSDEDIQTLLENIFALKNTLDIASEKDLENFVNAVNELLEDEESEIMDEDETKEDENSDTTEGGQETIEEEQQEEGQENEEESEEPEAKRKCKVKKNKQAPEEQDAMPENKKKQKSKKDEMKVKTESTSDKYKIVDPKEEVSEEEWGKIDKNELRKIVIEAVKNGELDTEDVKEIFGVVKCYDKEECLKFPIRQYVEGKGFVVNVNGLRTAALFLIKPNTSKGLSKEEKKELAKFLIKYYNILNIQPPKALETLAKDMENFIIIDVKDSVVKEYANSVNSNVDDVYNAIVFIENLINEMYNKGLLEIENTDAENVIIELDRNTLANVIMAIENSTDSIINTLSGEELPSNANGIVMAELDKIRAELKDALAKYEETKSEADMLKAKLSEYEEIINRKNQEIESLKLMKEKFDVLYNAVKNDENYLYMLNTLSELSSEEEIKVFKKVTESMKIEQPKFRKKSLISEDFEVVKSFIEEDAKTPAKTKKDEFDPVLMALWKK